MIINEKALIREMKEAYKRSGYTVAVALNNQWTISGGNWAVAIDGRGNVPNQVLSLIVLHMGTLPEAGTAYRIYKTKDGPQAQEALPGVELEQIKRLEALLQTQGGKTQYISATNLWYGRYRVWQQQENLQILLVNPRDESIIAAKKYVEFVAGTLFKRGKISGAYVWPHKDEKAKPHVKHLEGMQWV